MSLLEDQTIELNLLLKHGIINKEQHNNIHQQLDNQQSIMPLLINQHHISNDDISKVFCNEFNLETTIITSNSFNEIDPQSFRGPLGNAQYGVMLSTGSNIKIIASCMSDLNAIKSSVMHQFKVTCFLTDYTSICKIINAWQSHYTYTPLRLIQTHNSENESSPNIHQLTEFLLNDAVIRHASDIHIQPTKKNLHIRYRVDGVLTTRMELNKEFSSVLVNKIKLLAKLDISETRLPQDGRFSFTTAYKHHRDYRVNTCPSIHGEKAALRILNPDQQSLSLSQLDLNNHQLCLLTRTIQRPQGLILITGPTGSGKTNTLYALLNTINSSQKNIITIENPVELTLPGLHQINVAHPLSFGFNEALRACLRQDPDIIMIGEIRDEETAAIAIYAAQTGHLVLATLHANSTIDTITRLINMGIQPINLTHSLMLVIAQRLSRQLCDQCKRPGLSDEENQISNIDIRRDQCHHASPGCEDCINGYHGRIPIFEILHLPQEAKKILYKPNFNELLEEYFISSNTSSLWQSGLEKVAEGKTSLTEISRTIMAS